MQRQMIAALAAVTLAGCTAGQVGIPPNQRAVDVSTNTNALQFAVGTANIAGVATGLNTVVTWRQPNGLDGTLLSTPTITAPAGFTNSGSPAAAGINAGTATISGSPQVTLGTAAIASTLGTAGGAFAYGFQPNNSTASSNAPSFARYSLPFYAPAGVPAVPYIGGAPAYPNVRDGTYPSGFTGYPMGFTDFNVTPVAGTYALSLVVPSGFDATGNPTTTSATTTGTLTNVTPLGAITGVTFTPDGAGGGTVSATIADPRITEAMAIVRIGFVPSAAAAGTGACYPTPYQGGGPPGGSANGAVYYTTRVTAINTAGVTAFPAIPANIGPQYLTAAPIRSTCTGDKAQVYVVGFDYPAFGAGPPQSVQQKPVITGVGGQADISTSAVVTTAALP